VVYLQANIHAAEVEGTEAVLALLREVAGRGAIGCRSS
jgi:predicted deacylase